VLERALVTARLRQNDYPSIFPYVAGTIFLGTPFHGTNTQHKANVLAQMSETLNLGVASSLLKLLEKDSKELGRMLDEFVRLSHDAQIRVFCFFESHKSDLTSVLIKGMPEMFKTQVGAVIYGNCSMLTCGAGSNCRSGFRHMAGCRQTTARV
jgi:hypothetical protein